MTEDSWSELCLMLSHDQMAALLWAIKRINPLICSFWGWGGGCLLIIWINARMNYPGHKGSMVFGFRGREEPKVCVGNLLFSLFENKNKTKPQTVLCA